MHEALGSTMHLIHSEDDAILFPQLQAAPAGTYKGMSDVFVTLLKVEQKCYDGHITCVD